MIAPVLRPINLGWLLAISLRIRKRIHSLYRRKGWTQHMVAREVGVSRSTVQQILNRHPNDLAVRVGSGLQGKINESEIEYLTELYISNPKLTLQMYADKLLEKYAVDVTPQTIHYHLKKIKKLVGERWKFTSSCCKEYLHLFERETKVRPNN